MVTSQPPLTFTHRGRGALRPYRSARGSLYMVKMKNSKMLYTRSTPRIIPSEAIPPLMREFFLNVITGEVVRFERWKASVQQGQKALGESASEFLGFPWERRLFYRLARFWTASEKSAKTQHKPFLE